MSNDNHQEMSLTPQQVSKVKGFKTGSSWPIEGINNGSFAVASSKKDLKELMTSDVDVVYEETKGKLYLNANGEKKGWGAKTVGGLLAKFKGKPELTASSFVGLKAHKPDPVTGGDIKEQIEDLRDELGEAEVSELYGKTLLDPKKGIKSIIKAGKKEGFVFNKSELSEALNEMNNDGIFMDVELDDAAIAAIFLAQSESQGVSDS